jgi:hypothetical protein
MRKLFVVASFALIGCATMNRRIALQDVVGVWDVEARVDGSDAIATRYVLTIDTENQWTIQFPGDTPPLHPKVLSVAGDSIVTRAGPYASTLRQGVLVVTDGVFRLKDGKMIGRSVAHYNVTTSDSVRRINTTGTRR